MEFDPLVVYRHRLADAERASYPEPEKLSKTAAVLPQAMLGSRPGETEVGLVLANREQLDLGYHSQFVLCFSKAGVAPGGVMNPALQFQGVLLNGAAVIQPPDLILKLLPQSGILRFCSFKMQSSKVPRRAGPSSVVQALDQSEGKPMSCTVRPVEVYLSLLAVAELQPGEKGAARQGAL
jgi:hypothetical protein